MNCLHLKAKIARISFRVARLQNKERNRFEKLQNTTLFYQPNKKNEGFYSQIDSKKEKERTD